MTMMKVSYLFEGIGRYTIGKVFGKLYDKSPAFRNSVKKRAIRLFDRGIQDGVAERLMSTKKSRLIPAAKEIGAFFTSMSRPGFKATYGLGKTIGKSPTLSSIALKGEPYGASIDIMKIRRAEKKLGTAAKRLKSLSRNIRKPRKAIAGSSAIGAGIGAAASDDKVKGAIIGGAIGAGTAGSIRSLLKSNKLIKNHVLTGDASRTLKKAQMSLENFRRIYQEAL
ncbi:MAG: hypothetical protein SVK08_01910 [Halobacteriota archaeon]|nr:hypothetical protein [Halobacteriota archaeon]